MARPRRRLSRKTHVREQKRKIYVFCEGARTEKQYLNELARSNPDIVLEFERTGGVPKTLFDESKACIQRIQGRRDPHTKQDKVWLVFDHDEHPRVTEVLRESEDFDITVGYSNPCFEVWLLFHYTDYGSQDDRHAVKKTLAEICDDYCGKNNHLIRSNEIVTKASDAHGRAITVFKTRKKEGNQYGRPSSTMYRIVEDIMPELKKDDSK